MALPYELFIGLRYTRARRRTRFISFISATSMICIGLGVAILIAVLSVMNGFETEIRSHLLGMTSHATISAVSDGMDEWQAVAAEAAKNPEVEAVAPFIDGQAMLRHGNALSGAVVRGIDPAAEVRVSDIAQHLQSGAIGDLAPGAFHIVLGSQLAEKLHLNPGDKVDLLIPEASVTPAGVLPRFRRFTVSGLFHVGLYEFDSSLVLIDLHDAAALYRMGDKVSGLRLKLHDIFLAPSIARDIASHLPGVYYVGDWTRQHANYFKAVASQKQVMFLIFSLLVAVAVFNIVSTLVMMVREKQSDIAILRTIGASPRSVMTVFVVQGAAIGIAGTVLGVVLGVFIAWHVKDWVPALEHLLSHRFIDSSIYMLDELPSRVDASDLIRITGLSLLLSFLSTLYPAWRASRVQPAEALRYE